MHFWQEICVNTRTGGDHAVFVARRIVKVSDPAVGISFVEGRIGRGRGECGKRKSAGAQAQEEGSGEIRYGKR